MGLSGAEFAAASYENLEFRRENAVDVTSHFVTQMGGHSGGFLGPSSEEDFCGQICSFVRVHLSLSKSLFHAVTSKLQN